MGMLDQKTAIVTGGARGIGLAIGKRFVAEGARVVIADIDETAGKAAVVSLGAAARFFKAPTASVAVVHDDVDLEPGRLQARLGGGLAGHNGLRSISAALGSQDFLRLRIGVGRPGRGDRRDVADYVLSAFEPEEDADALVARAADAVETLARDGLETTQQRFN